MGKLILMSVMFVPVLFAIGAAKDPRPTRGVRKMTWRTFVFLVLWALLAPKLIMRLGLE
jgi:hypothetical protein